MKLILASGREVNTKTKTIDGTGLWNSKTAAEIARFQGIRERDVEETDEEFSKSQQNGPLIATLLDTFDADPVTTRQQLRELPEVRDPFISDLFALVIFLCDDLLSVRTESSPFGTSTRKAARFFQIARSLPIELQMLLCNRAFGAGKNSVLSKHSEPAFKGLGGFLTRSPTQ